MGLFDFLRKTKGGEPRVRDESATLARLRSHEKHNAFDTDGMMERLEDYLQELISTLDSPTLKALPDGSEVELRGSSFGLPVRLNVSAINLWVRIDVKVDTSFGELMLHRDHSKIPKDPDEEDAWATEDDLRIFVARGIFVQGYPSHVEKALSAWRRLPSNTTQWLLTEIERIEVSYIGVKDDGLEVHLGYLLELESASEQIRGAVALGAALAKGLINIAPPSTPNERGQHVKCTYCGTRFLMGAGASCPNCGAAYGA